MTEKPRPESIISIVNAKSADIEQTDQTIIHESVGVVMALDQLRESLNLVESHLNNREFAKASHVGYQEVAHNFVFLQRTLAGIQSAALQKESLISSVAQEANAAYEDVAPYVEERMESAVKKPV
jgi:hypothetical protein